MQVNITGSMLISRKFESRYSDPGQSSGIQISWKLTQSINVLHGKCCPCYLLTDFLVFSQVHYYICGNDLLSSVNG